MTKASLERNKRRRGPIPIVAPFADEVVVRPAAKELVFAVRDGELVTLDKNGEVEAILIPVHPDMMKAMRKAMRAGK